MNGETFVRIAEIVAEEVVIVFQNNTMQVLLSIIQEDIAEQREQNVEKEGVMELVKCEYLVE